MNRKALLGLLSIPLVIASGCGDDDSVAPSGPDYSGTIAQFQLAPLPAIPYPADNPPRPTRIELGRLLFFDPILGGESAPWIKAAAGKDPYRFRENDMACATCHFPSLGFADGRELSAGVGGAQFHETDLGPSRVAPARSIVTGDEIGMVPRNAPTCLNTAYNGLDGPDPSADSFMFLDGRVTEGLEAQAKLPITSRDEMAGDAYGPGFTQEQAQDSVTVRVRNIPEYVARFRQAFAEEIQVADDITIDHIARAIASYERELVTPGSRYDRFVSGDYEIFTTEERHGFEVFFGKALCGDCHFGPMLSDYTHHVQGAADAYETIFPGFGGKSGDGRDLGRFHADETTFADQKYAFRTLTVRNVEVTGPYFHSGSARTLRETVEFYNRGGRGTPDMSDAQLAAEGAERDPSIQPLGLTATEIDALVAFMRTTTAEVQPGPSGIDLTLPPERVPSGLVPPGVPTPAGPGPFLLLSGPDLDD